MRLFRGNLGLESWAARGRTTVILAALAVAGLAGCAPGSNLPPCRTVRPTLYRLGAGDQVRIITTGETQLSGEFRVNDAGTIAVPFLGTVPVAGLTTAELASRIERSLVATKLFRNPSVVAEVIAYRPIFVYGEVTRPGHYPYEPGMTVLTAITGAGGYTYRAVDRYAEVIRTEDGKVTEGTRGPARRCPARRRDQGLRILVLRIPRPTAMPPMRGSPSASRRPGQSARRSVSKKRLLV